MTDTTLEPLSPDEEAFLRALGRVMSLLPRVVDADMLAEQRLSSSEYMALVHLSEAPDHRMRISDLAYARGLSLSGTTRLVNRMEDQRLLARLKSPDDGRAWIVVLTPVGAARQKQAWRSNLASVRQHLFSRVEGCDLVGMTQALERIAPGSASSSRVD